MAQAIAEPRQNLPGAMALATETPKPVTEDDGVPTDKITGPQRFRVCLSEIEEAYDALLEAEDNFRWEGVRFHQTTTATRRSPLVLPGVMRALWRHCNTLMSQSNQGAFDGYCKAYDLLGRARRRLYRSDESRLNRKDVRVKALLE